MIHVTLPYSSRHLGVALSSRLRDVHCCSALLDALNQARFHGDPECQLVLELIAGGWLTEHHTATLYGSERNHGKVLRCRELKTELRFVPITATGAAAASSQTCQPLWRAHPI